MNILSRNQAIKKWQEYWDEMRLEWFKLEVLQDYSGEDLGPSLRAWLKGDKEKSMKIYDGEGWASMCHEKIRQGVELNRIRLVAEPRSEYTNWEIEIYKHFNIPKCKEKVCLLGKEKVIGLPIPAGDMMIFDNKRVVVNTYNKSGFMTKADFYDESDDISGFLELKSRLEKLCNSRQGPTNR